MVKQDWPSILPVNWTLAMIKGPGFGKEFLSQYHSISIFSRSARHGAALLCQHPFSHIIRFNLQDIRLEVIFNSNTCRNPTVSAGTAQLHDGLLWHLTRLQWYPWHQVPTSMASWIRPVGPIKYIRSASCKPYLLEPVVEMLLANQQLEVTKSQGIQNVKHLGPDLWKYKCAET